MNAINLVAAIFGGAGLYLVFSALTGAFGPKSRGLGLPDEAKTADLSLIHI